MKIVRRKSVSYLLTATALACVALTSGCNTGKSAPTPANFTQAINTHFLDHTDCLFPESPRFPYETSDPIKTKQMNTLVTTRQLSVEEELDIHASRYTPTATGARFAPRF